MITLHRLGQNAAELHLNPDLITTVEAHPDTVVTLTTGSKFLVLERPEEIAEAVMSWRAGILDAAWRNRHAVPA
jgi:flagellar protein FlbD